MSLPHTQPLPSDTAGLNQLRRAILRFCLDQARQTPDILDLPELQPFERRQLKKLIYALELAGLLNRWGNTKGTCYMANRLGFILLAALDERLPGNPPNWDILELS